MRFTSRLLLALFMTANVALFVGCTPPKPADGTGETSKGDGAPAPTGAVAKVNGKELGRADFQRQMDRTRERFTKAGRDISPALESRLKENLIRKLVDEELIAQAAAKENVKVSPEDLEARFAEHKGRFGNEAAFTSFLERTNQTVEDIREDLTKNALREALFTKLAPEPEPTDDDAKKYFDENKDKYVQREQIQASHVLVKVAKGATAEEKAAAKKKAAEVLKKAKAGTSFEQLAKEYSEGPTATRGGDLGKFSRGRMVKPFEDVAFAAKAGEIVGPVETQFGWHVIKVFEKTPERAREFAEVKDSILTSLKARQKSKATRDVLQKLKADAKVEIIEPGINIDKPSMGERMPLTPDGNPLLPERALDRMKNEQLLKVGGQRRPMNAGGEGQVETGHGDSH
jgi:peptidyl-prolyl cis-trans isomerase C